MRKTSFELFDHFQLDRRVVLTGLRAQHILELVTCREAGAELVISTTAFTNVLLEVRCHADVIAILFGGSLIALQKKCGGVRPIAIGYT